MKYSETILDAVRAIRAQATPVDLRDRRTLLANMVVVYQMIVATEPLLMCAKNSAIRLKDRKLESYFRKKRREEKNHDVWLAEDLKTAGLNVRKAARSRTAIAAAGSVYYMVRHVSPACLLGYMLVLEAFPMPIADVIALEAIHGEGLMRTIRHHAEIDGDHAADVMAMIDASGAPEIMDCAIQTAIYLNELAQEMGQ